MTNEEFKERKRLIELQKNRTRWFSQEEFDRLKELSNKQQPDVSESRFQSAYAQYWDKVKDIIDEEGWVYTKEAPYMLDAYFEGNTGKQIEFQKSFGRSGDNQHWLTRGSRWRPLELS